MCYQNIYSMEEFKMYQITIDPDEIKSIEHLLLELTSKYKSVEDKEFLNNVSVYAHELPRKLRTEINTFRLSEVGSGTLLISGFSVNANELIKTPEHWKNKPDYSLTIREDIFFALCSSLLGDVIGWATQQDGYILHDLLPIKGHELEQLGSGSETLLTWHTEEAFHPYRTDYLGLMCLRNPDHVETTYAEMDSISLEKWHIDELFQNKFVIRPDNSHLEKNQSKDRKLGASSELLRRSYDKIKQMHDEPENIAVLFGDPKQPYLRLDPYFMELTVEQDEAATEALTKIIEEIDNKIVGVALNPGDLLFIDNYKVVHGRKPFKARYDGNDRWLKRFNIARDIRKSRDSRISPENRIIF
jgi:Fe(II)/alpha-ketoglutarate-dependent arginine beta-hydroxylase